MSYRTTKVGGAEPDASNDVTVDLTDLADVSNVPAENNVLQYQSGAWVSASVPSSTAISYIFLGAGESAAYTGSPQGTSAITNTDTIYVYDSRLTTNSEINTISGATINHTSGWVTSITLPAGKYLVQAQSSFEFSSSSSSTYAIYSTANTMLTQIGVIGETRTTYRGGGSLAVGYLNLTSQTSIKLRWYTVNSLDSPSNQGNTPAEHGLIYVEKVS